MESSDHNKNGAVLKSHKSKGNNKYQNMKKYIFLFVIILFVGLTSNSFAQKDRKLSNGFSVNLVMGSPSDTYGLTSDSEIDAEYKLGGIWGLQLGNRWYFNPKEKYGIGLMINWIDFTGAVKTGTSTGVNWTRVVVDLTVLEFGPVATYALTNDIALDAYYNLRPTGFGHTIAFTGSGDDVTYSYVGLGFSNALGAAFRYKVFNLGFEYVFGSINSQGTYSGPGDFTLDDQKNMTNSFRVMLGVKL